MGSTPTLRGVFSVGFATATTAVLCLPFGGKIQPVRGEY